MPLIKTVTAPILNGKQIVGYSKRTYIFGICVKQMVINATALPNPQVNIGNAIESLTLVVGGELDAKQIAHITQRVQRAVTIKIMENTQPD